MHTTTKWFILVSRMRWTRHVAFQPSMILYEGLLDALHREVSMATIDHLEDATTPRFPKGARLYLKLLKKNSPSKTHHHLVVEQGSY